MIECVDSVANVSTQILTKKKNHFISPCTQSIIVLMLQLLQVKPEEVLIESTGVIGQRIRKVYMGHSVLAFFKVACM